MKLIIFLLALKGLMPSKKTRKKIAKHIKRARKLKRLADAAQGKPKKLGVLRKIVRGFRVAGYLTVGICAAAAGVKLYRAGSALAAKLPKKQA